MRRPSAASIATFVAVAGAVGIVFWQLDPALLLSRTTIDGGDTGAHVATAAFLKSYLIPNGHLTGWDPGWYDGFPLYTFYFPLPDLFAALGGYVVPFNIAFKLVTALGSLMLPAAAWAFGWLAGLERPRPAFLAAATLPYLFDQTYTIYGGNLYSTLAGEYAFSFGLALAIVFLGVVVRAMRTGRYRALGAALLAAIVLSHIVAMGFALLGAGIAYLMAGPTRRRTWWMVTTIGTAGLLTCWWGLPFSFEQSYTTNMGWQNLTTYAASLAPVADRWALGLAALGVVVALWRRDRATLLLVALGAISAVAFVVDPQSKLYNARFLPLWWICVYLTAGIAAAEVGVWLARLWRRRPGWDAPGGLAERVRAAPGAIGLPLAGLAGACLVVLPPVLIPYGSPGISIGPVHVRASAVPEWVRWNYSGYQSKPGWPEYHAIVTTMEKVAGRYGCGRAMWEYNPSLNRFGTPMALMLLPYWTGGCVDSMEGLLFESSPTTPYHFLNQAELSAQPSEAMVGLPYGPLDVPLGVEHLQMLGVRYFMASSPIVQAEAAADPALEQVAVTGPWHTPYQGQVLTTTWKIYLVRASSVVAPLAGRPAVLTGVGPGQTSWLPVAVHWYDNPSDWATVLTAGGPRSWTRVRAGSTPPAAPLRPVTVSKVKVTTSTVSFHVSRTGIPVLVKVSYFPAWHATGAKGPWRAVPNLMVVVPTSNNVTLTYGSTPAGTAGAALSALGLLALGVLVARRRALTVP